MAIQSIEDYLIDWANKKYAGRVIRQVNTEHEKLYEDSGKKPDYQEYEWMTKRLLEVHRELNIAPKERDDDKEKSH